MAVNTISDIVCIVCYVCLNSIKVFSNEICVFFSGMWKLLPMVTESLSTSGLWVNTVLYYLHILFGSTSLIYWQKASQRANKHMSWRFFY